jgi:hypothetical protein
VNQYGNNPVPARIEVRTLEGDQLLIRAEPDSGRWTVDHRDGRVVSVATMVEAALTVVRWAADRPSAPETTTLPGGVTPPTAALVTALRTLGAAGPASAADLLDVSGLILSDRERTAVLSAVTSADLPVTAADLPAEPASKVADLYRLAVVVGEVLAVREPDLEPYELNGSLDKLAAVYAQGWRPGVTP